MSERRYKVWQRANAATWASDELIGQLEDEKVSLLDALRHAVRMMEGMDDPHFVDCLKQAHAAMAKAEATP